MGSVGTPNTWQPYANYRDCSQAICSIYCPQLCYMIFPPPPHFMPEVDSPITFSPLIIGVIGILASAFLFLIYYTIFRKHCRRRGNRNTTAEFGLNTNQTTNDTLQIVSTGLDEAFIKSIKVCKYRKGDGDVEGTDCAVCLGEFQEGESLRLLPKCNHAFHLPCIDTWLKSHSNCPLCRSSLASTVPLLSTTQNSQNSSTLNISSLEIQRRSDLMLVLDDGDREDVVVGLVTDDAQKNCIQTPSVFGQEGVQEFRRSISLGSFSCQPQLSIADILLQIGEDDDELRVENCRISTSIGHHNRENNGIKEWELVTSHAAMKRSISTGTFMFTGHYKGESSVLPN